MKELLALLEAAGWLAGAIWLGAAVLACARRAGALRRAAGFLPASLLGGAALLAAGPAGAQILPISPAAWALVRSLPAVLIIPIIAAAPLGLNARAIGRPALSFTAILLGVSALQLAIGALFAAAFGAQIYATFGLELAAGFVGGHSTAGLISRALADLGAPWWADAQSVAAGTATVGLGGGILLGLVFIYFARSLALAGDFAEVSETKFGASQIPRRVTAHGLSTREISSQPANSPRDSCAAATSEDADASYINRNARARDGEAELMSGKFAGAGSAAKSAGANADKSAVAVASAAKSVTDTDGAADKSDVAAAKSGAAANSSGRTQFSGASGELGGQLSESNCPAVTDKCTAKPTDSAATATDSPATDSAADSFSAAELSRALCTLLVLSAAAIFAHAAAAPIFAGFGTWTYALFIALGLSLAAPRAAAAAAPAAPRRAIAAILSDFAIAAAIASMDLRLLSEHFAAFCALCALGFVATALFLAAAFVVCLPSRWFLRFIAAWGSSTGVFLTGILLLRAADPAGKSGVLSEYSIAFSLSGLVFYAVLQPVFALAAGGQALKAAAFMAALCAASALLAVLLRHKR